MSAGHPEFYHLECYTKNFNREIKVYPKVDDTKNICEECGKPVKELRARDRKDNQGRPIVEMVCLKCMTTKKTKKVNP
jgi:RNase P subunit RPR2